MVQNSLGRQWMMTYPDSSLKTSMDYYIEPAKQEASVETALAQQIPKELNPEHLTLIDPACGSGHILVEAYDLLTAIYLERGYRNRDIPKIILENNLYGLDIDERAAQMSAFALMMKARADDMRIFDHEIKLNVLAIQSTKDLDIEKLWQQLDLNKQGKIGTTSSLFEDTQTDLADVIDDIQYHTLKNILALFEQAETLGSLIQVPADLAAPLKTLAKQLQQLAEHGDTFQKPTANRLLPFIQQAEILAQRYDAVVANPPYMGGKGMNAELKTFAKKQFPDSKSDLFAMFILRCKQYGKDSAELAFVTPYVWMFISSYEKLREKLIQEATITTLIQLEYNAFEPACIPVCAFALHNSHISDYVGGYIKLSDFKGHKNQAPKTLEAINNPDCGWFHYAKPDDFKKIPSCPIAYWMSDKSRDCFDKFTPLELITMPKQGATTSDNNKFLRLWHEVDILITGFSFKDRNDAASSLFKWFPYNKGGYYRKWYGNAEFVVNYENDGKEIKAFHEVLNKTSPGGRLKNQDCYFQEQISWSKISSGAFAVRYFPKGFIFDVAGSAMFPKEISDIYSLSGVLNSSVTRHFLNAMSPTLNYEAEHIKKLPIIIKTGNNVEQLITNSRSDWNTYENSWDFQNNPLIVGWVSDSVTRHIEAENVGLRDKAANPTYTLSEIYAAWQTHNRATIAEIQRLEQENNRLFIDAYDLQDELTPDVPLEQITLTINPKYRYGGNLSDEELENRFREDTLKELISYALGCMMGRYRLDNPGLIYAHNENIDFDKIYNTPPSNSDSQNKYPENPFIADEDGIIPLTDREWFPDDATNRLIEFVKVAWSEETLNENLHFIADNLKPKASESSVDTIRRYFSSSFFKDHLKTYKKRPIYWLFSSGKHKAFEALVYLHRYNEGTLARMRMEYVIPLQSRISNQIDKLEGDIAAASSTASAKKAQKERDLLSKQHTELLAFDEQLRHYADQRIKLDLDDGVKVNYGKFGNLLAEVKAVTGKK